MTPLILGGVSPTDPIFTFFEIQIPGAFHLVIDLRDGTSVELMASAERFVSTVLIYQLHVDGAGPRSIGASAVLRLGRVLAEVTGDYAGADYVVIIGGVRTTGARPGSFPRPRVFPVKKP